MLRLIGRILEVKPVDDLFFGDVDRIVQDLRVNFANDVKRWHRRAIEQQSYG